MVDTRNSNGGQNIKITSDIKMMIEDKTLETPRSTLRGLSSIIEGETKINLATTSIQKTLTSLEFIQGKPSEKTLMSESTINLRMQYCNTHFNDKFSNVTFSYQRGIGKAKYWEIKNYIDAHIQHIYKIRWTNGNHI